MTRRILSRARLARTACSITATALDRAPRQHEVNGDIRPIERPYEEGNVLARGEVADEEQVRALCRDVGRLHAGCADKARARVNDRDPGRVRAEVGRSFALSELRYGNHGRRAPQAPGLEPQLAGSPPLREVRDIWMTDGGIVEREHESAPGGEEGSADVEVVRRCPGGGQARWPARAGDASEPEFMRGRSDQTNGDRARRDEIRTGGCRHEREVQPGELAGDRIDSTAESRRIPRHTGDAGGVERHESNLYRHRTQKRRRAGTARFSSARTAMPIPTKRNAMNALGNAVNDERVAASKVTTDR